MSRRLTLRPTRVDDWTTLRAIDGDPAVMATLGGLRSEKETMAYALAQEDHWQRYGFGWWMAFERGTGDFVGRGGLRHLEIDGVLEIEVGYAVVRAAATRPRSPRRRCGWAWGSCDSSGS